MLGGVGVCAKDIFQIKGQPTLEGHNFHIIQQNQNIQKLPREHPKMSYKLF